MRDECDAMVTKALTDADPDTAWWRVKEARRLRGRAAAVAQEVAKWREQQAMDPTDPCGRCCPTSPSPASPSDRPKDADALGKVRGLRDRGIPKSLRDDLLEAIERGRTLDLDEVVIPESAPVPSELRAAIPLLMSWVTQRARQLDLDPAVLATRTDLEAFLRGDQDSRLVTGWRADALATDIRALLDGDASLTFERGEGLVLRRDR